MHLFLNYVGIPDYLVLLPTTNITAFAAAAATTNTTPPWLQSASEPYRQSGRRRSAKLVPTFADRGVSRGQRNGTPQPLNLCFLDRGRYFFIQVAPQLNSRG